MHMQTLFFFFFQYHPSNTQAFFFPCVLSKSDITAIAKQLPEDVNLAEMEKNSEFSCLPSDITDFGTTPIFGLHILRQIILNLTTVRIEMEPSIFWNGTIITCSELPYYQKRFWRVRFESGTKVAFSDEEILNMLVLHPLPPAKSAEVGNVAEVVHSSSNKRTTNIYPHLMVHVLDTYPVEKKVVEGKEKKFQPEKYCNLRAFCWSAMNQDGLKSLDSDNTKLVGRPKARDKRTSKFCRGCMDSDGKFVSMCEMCYAHTHTSRGYWKMNSSTIAQPMQPKV